MKNRIIALMVWIVLFLFSSLLAQVPDTVWTRTYGGTLEDACESVKQTSDGGYILVGETRSFSSSLWSDVWLIKTDSLGDTIWTKTYGKTGEELGYSVQQTLDGGYIITGYTGSYGAGMVDIYLIKTDSLGDTIWTKTHGWYMDECSYSVKQTSDGGYIIVGDTGSFGYFHALLVKTDSFGDTIWTKRYGAGYFCSVQQTSDEGYILAGGKTSNNWDVYLTKTDSLGNSLWQKTYGGVEYDKGYSVQLTSDGGYIIAGLTGSFGAGHWDVYLIKTDSIGDTLWTRTYGGTNFDKAWEVKQTIDGGYIIIGETQSFGPGSRDVWLIKTDSNGDSLWARIYGGLEYDIGYSIQQTFDGGFIIGGKTASIGAGLTDAWLLKIEPDVGIQEEQIYKNNLYSSNIKVFPNPFRNILHIKCSSKVKIYDSSGKFVTEVKSEWDGRNAEGKNIKAGIYFLKADGKPVGKVVKVR
ncbi:T9SS type A sorting domain-containing protein [candidate division WOR-3 bacterium]|nr:T9SS type A sorting domain-containing protein [candidate division WOR-3 bacterium]